MEQYYVEEILDTVSKAKHRNLTLSKVLATIINNDTKIHIECKEPKMCENCKIPLKVDTKWLLEIPQVYTLGL